MSNITYQIERWDSYYRDCQELWQEDYNEMTIDKKKMPFSPNLTAYEELDKRGMLVIVTARKSDIMIGYFLCVINHSLHYSTNLFAYDDTYFLTNSERKGWQGVKMIKKMLEELRERKVDKMFLVTLNLRNSGILFKRLGFENEGAVHTIWLGE